MTNGLVTKAPRGDQPQVTKTQPTAHNSSVGESLAARTAGWIPATVPVTTFADASLTSWCDGIPA
jgi:hypothetical protein